jgi:hypothetical protein
MCDRCKAIDIEVQSFRRLHAQADDHLALALITEAIADLEAEKASLHPDEREHGKLS